MKFRKTSSPKMQTKLYLPPLSHITLTNVRICLHFTLTGIRQPDSVPFLNPVTGREAYQPNIDYLVGKFMKTYHGLEEPCCCHKFLTLFQPQQSVIHVVVDGLFTGLSHSANIFEIPDQCVFRKRTVPCFSHYLFGRMAHRSWLNMGHFLPIPGLNKQWETHLQQVRPDALR
jgi:hypothetical protein